jgi:hypothetical protein
VRAEGKHDPDRAAVRHGAGEGSVVLGGRRVPVVRPRARTVDGHEVPLAAVRAPDQVRAVDVERAEDVAEATRNVAAVDDRLVLPTTPGSPTGSSANTGRA